MTEAGMDAHKTLSTSAIRCAIYTRKSHEDGLDQDFNSLDAQREACAAYILSQRHEGWTLIPEHYNDGGYSGGSMERPGLQALLADVTAGRVDVIVIYKIDRLTRSLTDFAKLAELFDAKGVSFVSVTQSFNTTTSMGRLMLNVLLSFAQFEREVTGERIRDKIAASKKKGLWMGGPVPLGYEVRDRKLVVQAEEAETVRMIFARYLELGSVVALQGDLKARGIVSKRRVGKNGKTYGNVPLTRGALYNLLQNRIYKGDICHKGVVYAGEHAAIVPADLFDSIQALLASHRLARKRGTNAKEPSLLAGIVWDAHGRRLSPSHARKQAKRYRYYVSREEIPSPDKPKWRIPASALEEAVIGKVRQFLISAPVHNEFLHQLPSVAAMEEAQSRMAAAAEQLTASGTAERRTLLLDLVRQIIVHEGQIEIIVNVAHLTPNSQTISPDQTLTLTVPARLVRAAGEVRLALPPDPDGPPKRDLALIKLIVRAHALRRALNNDPNQSIEAIAAAHHLTPDYVRRLLRLSTLAPDIITAILEGRQPANLTREKLARATRIPLDWPGQRKALAFS